MHGWYHADRNRGWYGAAAEGMLAAEIDMTADLQRDPQHDPLSLDELRPEVRLSGYWNPREAQWHRYCVPGHHLLLIEEGAIDCRTPTSRFRAEVGDLVAFRSADLNEYGNHGPVALYQIHVLFAPPPRDRQPLSLGHLGLLPEHLPMGERFPRARRCFETICMDLGGPRLEQRASVLAAFWEIIALACGAMEASGARHATIDPWERARARLDSDPLHPVEIRRLAAEMEVSVAHFTRRFRQRFGVNPARYRTQSVLRHAATVLVAEPELSVKALAHRLGFTDDWSFTRAFRRHFGLLPSEVRSGAALAPATAADGDGDALMQPNRHIVPSGFPEDWIRDYYPRTGVVERR